MIADITVVPKSGRFSISLKDNKVKVFLRSAAENNKANLELVKELEKRLECGVRIVSGHKSKRKRLEFDLSEDTWNLFVRSFLENNASD
ncbi:DUF167 domain-containing protein [Candidatus Micrarchaeota archaeon]|nr:DUF167 domain-containing protein [Candidatus Micrarchaeota archaeon]